MLFVPSSAHHRVENMPCFTLCGVVSAAFEVKHERGSKRINTRTESGREKAHNLHSFGFIKAHETVKRRQILDLDPKLCNDENRCSL